MHNILEYQDYNKDGKLVTVAELTKEELQQNLCKLMDWCEENEIRMQAVIDSLEEWRKCK